MITQRQAHRLLSVGDHVYTISSLNTVVKETIKSIHEDCLETETDYLFFDDHGYDWWLTERIAQENIKRGLYG